MTRLGILFVTAFVDMVGVAMVLPLLPYYATAFGANAVTVGVLVATFSVAQLACAPLWGKISDVYGRRPAILAGLSITAVAYVLFGAADSIGLLLASRAVQGVGAATIGVVQAYVADASRPEARTRSLGWLSAVTSLGAVVGPAFGSATIAIGGRAAPGYAAAVLAATVAAFAWRFLRETAPEEETTAHSVTAPSAAWSAAAAVVSRWREPAPRLIWVYAIAIGSFYGMVPTMPLLLQERLAISEYSIGYIVMLLGGVGVVARAILLGPAVQRLGEERLSQLGLLLLAAGLALFGATAGYSLLVASLLLMPLGTAFLFPCVSAQLTRVVSHRKRGLYLGIQQAFGGASRVVFPIGAGIAMDRLGLGVPFFVAAGCVLAALWVYRATATTVSAATVDAARVTPTPSATW
ncbi:MAG: MFS transporter [Gemmatimonadales bacterium]|jgi:MFS family permease